MDLQHEGVNVDVVRRLVTDGTKPFLAFGVQPKVVFRLEALQMLALFAPRRQFHSRLRYRAKNVDVFLVEVKVGCDMLSDTLKALRVGFHKIESHMSS